MGWPPIKIFGGKLSIRKIAIISGTRPEAIKLAPVYLKSSGVKVDYVKTGQL